MSNKSVAVICTGGGTRCAFSAGALVAFAQEFDFIKPNIIIAASGSTGNACYFASQQYASIERIWKKHLASWRFFSMLRMWRMMDIDYLVDTIFKKKEPFDIETFNTTPIVIRFPLLNLDTKKIEYVDPTEHEDVFEILRAAKAVPFIYGKEIRTNNATYVDGAVVATVDDMIHTAEKLGATHVVVFENRVRNPFFKKAKQLIGSKYSANKLMTTFNRVCVFTIHDNETHAWFATTNPEKLSKMFNNGYDAVKNNKELLAFIT